MSVERKLRWRKEIDWLLSVTDHIVEMVPSQQTSKEGIHMEVKNVLLYVFIMQSSHILNLNSQSLMEQIMTTRQRTDLLMNIPALRKLDAMLIV